MTRTYDVVMTHRLDTDDFFILEVQRACAAARCSFFLIEPTWVRAFHEAVEAGLVRARVLLNLHSEHHLPDDPFHRLVRLLHAKGTRVVDPPDSALAAFDKSRMHGVLAAAGLMVPPTLLVRAGEVGHRGLTTEERALLGGRFVIKPSLGYGRRGVILDAESEADLARAAVLWPDPVYLLQRRMVPRREAGRPVYLRGFHVFGSVWLCWWDCDSDRYQLLGPGDWERHQLGLVEALVRRIAGLSGMQFFSSEFMQLEDRSWCVIDYVNDQCHMLTQSADPRIGVPDLLVSSVARRLVDGALAALRADTGGLV